MVIISIISENMCYKWYVYNGSVAFSHNANQ